MDQLFTSVAASGFIIRDGNGNPIIAGARKIGRTSVPLAEAIALCDSLIRTKIKGLQ